MPETPVEKYACGNQQFNQQFPPVPCVGMCGDFGVCGDNVFN